MKQKILFSVLGFSVLCILTIGFYFAQSGKQQNTGDDKVDMASLQRISQIEDEYYKNIADKISQSDSSKERIGLYDIILTETQVSKEYENILEEILKKYLISANTEQFNRFKEFSMLLGKGEISIADFRIILEDELDISISSIDIETLQKESIAYIDEQDAYLIRLISQTEVLESNLETTQQLIVQNIVTQVLEQVQNITKEEIEEITIRITDFFTQEGYVFSVEEFILLLQSISDDYSIELAYKELIERYIDYEEIQVLLQEYISQISYIQSEIPLQEYQTLIEQFNAQVESLWETQTLFEVVSLEEIEAYFEKELSYGDLEVLFRERQESISTLSDITRAYLDESTFRDDSELLVDMRPIAYIEKIEGGALVRNLYDSPIIGSSNQLLYAGYSIETLPGSTLTIVFHDDSLLRMEEGSRITLIGEREEIKGIKIEYGNIWTRIIKPFFSGESFEIEGERLSLAVRGTSIYIEKNGDNENIYIIDTVTNTEQSGVVLRDETNGNNYNLSSGKSIVSNNELSDIIISDTPRLSLLESKNTISAYIQEDLRYMSLLLDDRKRGFFNTPFGNTDTGENFLDKVSAEIEVSLPTQSEKGVFFRSAELINHVSSNNISSENIYELIIKDDLIETIKTYQSPVEKQKIEEILSLDVAAVLDSLGNKRSIEDRIESNIVDEILESSTSVEEILISYDIDEVYSVRQRINKAYETLEIPGGNVRLIQDVSLPSEISSDSQISLTWKLENDTPFVSLLNTQEGQLLKIEQPINTDSIQTTLGVEFSLEGETRNKYFPFIVVSRDYTDSEKLDIASKTLSDYINLYSEFTDNIILPRFNAYDSIAPEIQWIQDSVVNRDGTLNRPEYSENEIRNYQARARLSFGNASKDVSVILKNIRKKPLIPEENIELPVPVEEISLLKPEKENQIETIQIEEERQVITEEIIQAPQENLEQIEIAGDIYNMVAEADFNSSTDVYGLRLSSGGNLANSYINVGSGLNNNNAGVYKSYLAGIIEKRPFLNLKLSQIKIEDQIGIILDNIGKDDFLSYDLSGLPEPLGDNWVIEISVRGEDLKRNDGEYFLISSPGEFFFSNSKNKKEILSSTEEKKYYSPKLLENKESRDITINEGKNISNGFYSIRITKDSLYIDDSLYATHDIKLGNIINIGSDETYGRQWNGIINFVKIYIKE